MKCLCKKNYMFYFESGKYYENKLDIDNENIIRIFVNNNSCVYFNLVNKEFNEYFYSEKEIRKMKLKKLKIK